MKMRIPSGITLRVTYLTWTVTLATLGIFMAFIIPEQKRELRDGLESKAHGITVALQGEVASAAISEDYSAVVEHAMQVVAGDPEVQFLVITKSDGYSVLIEREGWRVIQKIDAAWYERPRAPSSELGYVSLVQRREFHYRIPFDYNGIPWGWVHAGLSLENYDRSVKLIYLRTGLIGTFCIVLSLVVSTLFARRFVRPILSLRSAVNKVAKGDLAARAEVKSRDEISQLAEAFNDMTEAVLQRDQIVETVRFAAQALQGTDDWNRVIEEILERIGHATHVTRALIVEHEECADSAIIPRLKVEWHLPGIAPYGAVWSDHTLRDLGFEARAEILLQGQTLLEGEAEISASPIPGPDPQPKSAVVTPIFTDGRLWGALIVQDCERDRDWRDVEQHSIRAIADMLGAFIVRQNARQALVEAKNELERRVEERTQELREQIVAKDRAHDQLQQAQRQLIELSRLSGMAEVATGVLHNVGNVLNSINVSATLLTDHMRASRLAQLKNLTDTLATHPDDLNEFLTKDPKGQRVVPYLVKLSSHLLEERDQMLTESESLMQNVGHVKEIVSMQQGYARASGVLEKVPPQEMIRDALAISGPAIDRHHIVLKKELESMPEMITDRHKVLQILLNLIQNAKEAIKASAASKREITLRLKRTGTDKVRFQVQDNGVGIAAENLTRIFSHGFTTKESGHGFGLHSGALAAKQLGGELSVMSSGLGSGALFTLDLPINSNLAAGKEACGGR